MSSIDHRHECTADDPWAREKSFYGDHPDAEYVRTDPDGGQVHDCPHCGLQFRVWPDRSGTYEL